MTARVRTGPVARLAALATATALTTSGATLPALPADGAVTASSSTVSVPMPGPGHSSAWSGSLTNPGGDAVDAHLTVTEVGGASSSFGDLLTATVSLPSGRVVIPETPVADLVHGTAINVGPVAAGSTLTLDGTITLSRSTGDEFQGLGASVVFQLTSVEAAAPRPPLTLPDTGSTIATSAIVVAAAAIAGGGVLLIARKRRKKP